jgi:hypothetical protein
MVILSIRGWLLMRPNSSYGLNVRFLGVAVLLLTLAPRPGLAQSGILDVRTLCSPLEIHEGNPDEKACLKELASVAKRDGGVLTLKLNNGKTRVLSDAKECGDTTQEGACVTRRLVGYIGDRQFIVQVVPYECPHVLLVNRRTGEETILGGWPNLSPNKKRFAVTASNVGGGCSFDNAVAIFSLASDPPRLEWQFKPEAIDEDYDTDGWDGENRVRLRVDVKGKQTATDLKLTPQGWQLKRPAAPVVPR